MIRRALSQEPDLKPRLEHSRHCTSACLFPPIEVLSQYQHRRVYCVSNCSLQSTTDETTSYIIVKPKLSIFNHLALNTLKQQTMKSISFKASFFISLRITRADAFQCAPSNTASSCPFGTTQWRRATEAQPQRNSHNRKDSMESGMVADPAILDVVSYLPSLTLGDPIVGLAHSRPSPTVEAEILSNMSHVALDLFGFLNPERFLLRLSALLGRMMLMAADYDVDHKISADEMLFQGGMLALSAKQFMSSWCRIRGAQQKYGDVSFRERVVYQLFFSPVGVSWLQFRSLVASCVDRVEVQPNETLETINHNGEQVAYWLYNGQVAMRHRADSPLAQEMHHRRGKPVGRQVSIEDSKVDGKSTKEFGLLAGPGALSALVDFGVEEDGAGESLQLVVGDMGATMMRVNVAKLRELMDDDEKIDKTVRNLVLLSRRSKMQSVFAAANETVAVQSA
jgi:hypothetical protein